MFLEKVISFFANIRNPPRQPMLWAALAYGAGTVCGVYAWRPPFWWMVAAVGFALAALYFARRRWWLAFPLALGTLFSVGALAIQSRNARRAHDDGLLAFATGEQVVVTAHVIHGGETRPAGLGGLRQSVDVETEEIASDEQTQQVRGGMRVSIYAKEPEQDYDEGSPVPMRVYHYGECLRFSAKLRAPRNFRNPGAFDYRGYLSDHGIGMLASAKSATVEVLPGFVGSRVEWWRERVHRSIVRRIHALWNPEDAALMDAAGVGESAFLTPSTKVDFQRSGTYHVLVVSGMNVSILAFVIFWAMRRLRLSDFLASADGAAVCSLCVRDRRRTSGMASGVDVDCLPGRATAVPRAFDAECARERSAGCVGGRSQGAARAELSTDIPGGVPRRGGGNSRDRPNIAALSARPAQLRFDRLRPNA